MPTTGYLREKKGRYYAVINLYDSDGKRIQKSHATGLVVKNNKRKAEQFLKKLCVEYDTKKLRVYSNIKVSDYFKQWLVTIQNEVRANTFRSYKGNMERHIIPYFEKKNIELQDLKPFQLSDFYKSKVGSVSITTIKHFHQNISKALSDAVERGLITINPASAAKTPKPTKSTDVFKAEFLNRVQIDELLTYLEGTSIYLPVYLCCVYGFRRSEVLGLKWHNIDFERIRETLQQTTKAISGDTSYVSTTKTDSSNRTLPMIPQVKKLLLEQRKRQAENRDILKGAYISNDYVCTFDDGREMSPNYLSKKFHQLIVKQTVLPHIRFHDLRHSVASNLLNEGFTTVQVAEWLGHSSSTTTLKFYAHIDKTSKMAIAKSLQTS